eukprot:215904_1
MIKMTSQTAFLILGAVFTLQMMSGCEAGRFDKINSKAQHASGSRVEMETHHTEEAVDDAVAPEDKPYCCRKYTTFPKTPDAEGFPASLVTHVNSLVSGFLTSSNSTVHLSSSVGFCGEVVTIGESPVHCVPLCCTCCADITVRDNLVLAGSDLHLCCPEATDGECYVLDGSTGKVTGEVDPGHADAIAALDALLEAIDTIPQGSCECITVHNELDNVHSLHDAAQEIAELPQCAAASEFLASDARLELACGDYTGTCSEFIGDYRTSVTAARDCFRSEPVTVYCAPRSECGFNHN